MRTCDSLATQSRKRKAEKRMANKMGVVWNGGEWKSVLLFTFNMTFLVAACIVGIPKN